MDASTLQPHFSDAESEGTVLTLSSKALSMLTIEEKSSGKADEQRRAEYEVAQKKYQEKVSELPVDYRKMKVTKDRIDEEIKKLKAEIHKIEQSNTLDEKEMKQAIRIIEQQIADKSLAALEIGKEFTKRLKEQERSKQISPENATAMLKLFNSSPPAEPEKNL